MLPCIYTLITRVKTWEGYGSDNLELIDQWIYKRGLLTGTVNK